MFVPNIEKGQKIKKDHCINQICVYTGKFDNPRLFFQSRINPRLILDEKLVADPNLRSGLFTLRLILDYF